MMPPPGVVTVELNVVVKVALLYAMKSALIPRIFRK